MQIELTATVNGKKYCLYCMKELQDEEVCSCKASQKALKKAEQNALRKSLKQSRPDHRHDVPPRKQTIK